MDDELQAIFYYRLIGKEYISRKKCLTCNGRLLANYVPYKKPYTYHYYCPHCKKAYSWQELGRKGVSHD